MSSRRRPDSQPSSARRRRSTATPTDDSTPTDSPDEWVPDSDLFLDGIDTPDEASSPIAGVGVPAVVAVVATRDAGARFDSLLASLADQDYANLITLIVDAGSATDPTERVAEILPSAFVKRIDSPSFAAAANAALGTVDGASFYLFLHDDVELGPGTVQAMVEEAFRSNAGIVGAKIMQGADPTKIESVGAAIDKFGFLWPIAEEGELDQSQHDAIREAFVVSSAAMLIRCDLFRDLGGFSTDIDGSGEDLDLCWRARVAGARTVVMPAATVVHHNVSRYDERHERSEHLALRHQARVMLTCYGALSLLRILPQAMVLAFLDMNGALLRGRIPQSRAVFMAFLWNLAHLPTTLRIRRATQKQRRTPDEEIRRLQIKGSARFTNFFHEYTSRDRSMAQALAAAARGVPGGANAEGAGLWGFGAFAVSALLLLIGSRSLITGSVAAVREFVPIDNPGALLTEWWTGWRTAGLGQAGGAPTINVVAWLLNVVTFGHTGMVRTLLFLGPLPIGAIAAWRLFRGIGSPAARLAALTAYLVNPIPYNAISEGRWQALAVWAAAPVLVGRIGQAGMLQPFDRSERAARPVVQQTLGLGLVLAAVAAVAPVVLVVFVALVIVIAAVVGVANHGNLGRLAAVSAGALGVSAVLHLPWTIEVLTSSNRLDILFGNSPGRTSTIEVTRALLFDSGSHGNYFTLGLLAVVASAVMVTVGPVYRWALFSLAATVGSVALVLVSGRLAPSVALPIAEVLLVPAAVGAAVAAGVGAESIRAHVIGGAFGLRHLMAGIGVLGLVLAAVPFLTDITNGRWNSPTSDIDVALDPLRERVETDNARTLWIGDSDAVSLHGWELAGGMKFNVTNGVRPSFSTLFPPAEAAGEAQLRAQLTEVLNGETGRFGEESAAFGIRYVVVLERFAPLPYGRLQLEIDNALQERLNQQFDLTRLDVAPGIEVYENLAAVPVVSTTSTEVTKDSTVASLIAGGLEAVELADGLENPIDGVVPSDRTTIVLGGLGDDWTASVDGATSELAQLDGATAVDTLDGGDMTLRYDAPIGQIAMHLVQLLALVIVLVNRRGYRWWIGRARPHDPAMADLLEAEEVL